MSIEDLFSIRGKRALVTGGGRGIGEMIARGFAEAGCKVYIASRKKVAVEATAAEISKVGTCIPLVADLSREDECRRLADEIGAVEDGLEILVNNSGANWGTPYEDYDDKAWSRVLDLNVKGVFHLTRFLTPLLEAAGSEEDPARVINIGSIDGIQVPALETYAYSASKAAVHHMTAVLARKLAPRHITVNAIAPGPFQSQMMKATLESMGDAAAKMCPLGRIGRPDDMAGACIYLASRAGAWLTANVIPVDGGISGTR